MWQIWPMGAFSGKSRTQLEMELAAAKHALAQVRADLKTSFNVRDALARRVIEVESELKGIRWTLDKFFEQTPFAAIMQRFVGQYDKGTGNESNRTSDKFSTNAGTKQTYR